MADTLSQNATTGMWTIKKSLRTDPEENTENVKIGVSFLYNGGQETNKVYISNAGLSKDLKTEWVTDIITSEAEFKNFVSKITVKATPITRQTQDGKKVTYTIDKLAWKMGEWQTDNWKDLT